MDTRTIPESYILLRNVKKLPYQEIYNKPEEAAKYFGVASPVALVQNDSAIVTGNSLLQAFDRLEVLENTAHSIISSKALGDIVHITEAEVEDLKKAFSLVD